MELAALLICRGNPPKLTAITTLMPEKDGKNYSCWATISCEVPNEEFGLVAISCGRGQHEQTT